MIFLNSFKVRAPIEQVRQFHSLSANMAAITMPPVIVRFHRAPAILQENDEMEFSLWLGPLPVRWLARIEAVSPQGFIDRQLHGPFQEWVHHHIFEPLDPDNTLVRDEVHIHLKRNLRDGLTGLVMILGLPVLFAYRGWKTHRLLETQR